MRLADFIALKSIHPKQCAEAIGLHVSSVYRLMAGEGSFPNLETIRAIHQWSGGLVTANDFIDAPRPVRKSKRGRPRHEKPEYIWPPGQG